MYTSTYLYSMRGPLCMHPTYIDVYINRAYRYMYIQMQVCRMHTQRAAGIEHRYVDVYINIHMHIYIHACVYVHTYVHTCVHTYVHTYVYTHIHTHTHTHTHAGRTHTCPNQTGLQHWQKFAKVSIPWPQKFWKVSGPANSIHWDSMEMTFENVCLCPPSRALANILKKSVYGDFMGWIH